jgi:hypothetical protein
MQVFGIVSYDDVAAEIAAGRAPGEHEVHANARIETRFAPRTGIRRTPSTPRSPPGPKDAS